MTSMLMGGFVSVLFAIQAGAAAPGFADIAGIALGESPQSAPSLVPLTEQSGATSRYSGFVDADTARRFSLAGVPLAPPGLVYRFLDDRLHAVEGRLPPRGHAFAKLLDQLTRRYGPPDVREGWAGSPPDSFVFRQRLNMAGWLDRRTNQRIWLTGHDGGGLFVLSRGLQR
jgi:hypothetical protein